MTSAQTTLLKMRFAGYVGVQSAVLLIPVLLYQLTGNLALAGLAVMAEWAPKIAMYVLGGSVVSRWGAPRAHKGLELLRVFALAALLACALGHGGVVALVGAAAIYQCANAVSNVLFDRGVSYNWPAAERPLGHMLHMRQDQLACFLALVVGVALDSAVAVASVALLGQALTWAQSLKHASSVHPEVPHQEVPLAAQVKADVKAFCAAPMVKAWLYYVALGVPFAAVNSFVVFMLGAGGATAVGVATTASVLLTRVAASLAVMQWAIPRLLKKGSERVMAKWGFIGSAGCFALLAWQGSLWVSAVAITGVALCKLLILPYLRSVRQALISQFVPDKSSRPGATGLFASGEAVPYLIGGALAWALQGSLGLLLGTCMLVGAVGAGLFVSHERASLSTRAEQGSGE